VEGGVGRYLAVIGRVGAVGEVGRDAEGARALLAHADEAHVPALDDGALAEHEAEQLG